MKTKPLKLLLLSAKPSTLAELFQALLKFPAATVDQVDSAEQGWQTIQTNAIDVLVVDERLGKISGLDFVRAVVSTYPMINCALVSPLSHEDFHEASEGLGVFMQLPVAPGAEEATRMMELLEILYAHLPPGTNNRSQP